MMWCAGFKLETLLKLADCRGSGDYKTFLHYVLSQLLQHASDIDRLPKELVTARLAAKLQVCCSTSTGICCPQCRIHKPQAIPGVLTVPLKHGNSQRHIQMPPLHHVQSDAFASAQLLLLHDVGT